MDEINTKNMSGHGEFTEVPSEIKGWSWGTFWLGWIWGIGNKTYIALLGLIPILNIGVKFYLGFKGNELAWSNKYWYSIEDFKDTQKKWAKWGWGVAAIITLIFLTNVVDNYKIQKQSEVIKHQVMTQLTSNDKTKELIGNNYRILSGPSLMRVDKKTYGATMIILTMEELVFVNVDIEDENIIKGITLSWGEDESKDVTEIYP